LTLQILALALPIIHSAARAAILGGSRTIVNNFGS